MASILCTGPGPHFPVDGVLGQSSVAQPSGVLCSLCAALAQQTSDAAAQAGAVVEARQVAAETTLTTLATSLPAWKTQLAGDITAVLTGGWDGMTAQQRTDIMGRVLRGFGTAMTATVDHAIVTGAIVSDV